MTRSLATYCLAIGLVFAGLRVVAEEAAAQASPKMRTLAGTAPPARFYSGFSGYTRRVTCSSAEAQRWFDQGIQLLYGYNHDEAIRSFERAAAIDSSCAMAWWGSAYARGLHINNPVMGEEQSRLADEAAQKAVAALDDESDVERALVAAVRQRYRWPAPKDRTPPAVASEARPGRPGRGSCRSRPASLVARRRLASGQLLLPPRSPPAAACQGPRRSCGALNYVVRRCETHQPPIAPVAAASSRPEGDVHAVGYWSSWLGSIGKRVLRD